MIYVTIGHISGKEITEVLGIARGSIVLCTHLGNDFFASFTTLTGGEIEPFTDLFEKAQVSAIKRMLVDAEKRGANAVVGVKMVTNTIETKAAEVLALGTAVIVE